jgi:hypothetical protein
MTPNDDGKTTQEPMRVCAECDWFVFSMTPEGECRKRAPIIASPDAKASWPRVAESHWCGDWSASDDTE